MSRIDCRKAKELLLQAEHSELQPRLPAELLAVEHLQEVASSAHQQLPEVACLVRLLRGEVCSEVALPLQVAYLVEPPLQPRVVAYLVEPPLQPLVVACLGLPLPQVAGCLAVQQPLPQVEDCLVQSLQGAFLAQLQPQVVACSAAQLQPQVEGYLELPQQEVLACSALLLQAEVCSAPPPQVGAFSLRLPGAWGCLVHKQGLLHRQRSLVVQMPTGLAALSRQIECHHGQSGLSYLVPQTNRHPRNFGRSRQRLLPSFCAHHPRED